MDYMPVQHGESAAVTEWSLRYLKMLFSVLFLVLMVRSLALGWFGLERWL